MGTRGESPGRPAAATAAPRRHLFPAARAARRDPRPGRLRPRRVCAPGRRLRRVSSPPSPPRSSRATPELRGWTGRGGPDAQPGGAGGTLLRAGRPASSPARRPLLLAAGVESAAASRCGASGPHRAPLPARGRLVMLPKVETEALGLARSHGDQGQMPGNMQGKRARRSGSPCLEWPSRAARASGPLSGAGIKVYGS